MPGKRTKVLLASCRQEEAGNCRRDVGYLFTVAQIFNLPYRRFVIGRASVTPKTLESPHDPQVTNLRYSRLQVCATGVRDTVNRYRGRGSEGKRGCCSFGKLARPNNC